MELNNTFKLVNEKGQEIVYVGLSVVENPENGQRYLIYTEADNAKERGSVCMCIWKREWQNCIRSDYNREREDIDQDIHRKKY